VYGFAGDRSKSVLSFGASNNEIIYPIGALGVIMELSSGD